MKNTISKMLILCLALIALIQPGPRANAQGTSAAGNAYGLGVTMGFTSFQATVHSDAGLSAFESAVYQAMKFAKVVQTSVPNLNVETLEGIHNYLVWRRQSNADQGLFGYKVDPKENMGAYHSKIVTLRGEYSGILWLVTKQMGNAYDLGVAISIAEGQATVGEPARGIVRSALVSAQAPAANLGLSAKELAGIIAQIDQGVAVNSIYGQVSNLRGKYQSLLSALQPVIPGPKIATGQGAPVDADADLLKRGCTRPGVGSYKCPTVGGYEACESYRLSGKFKVNACSTSANEKVQAAMERTLFSVGCSRFLGRAEEFMCKTPKSFDLCETYRKSGTAKKCLLMK
jgi:hypothetical protein